jgi:hypothetical protein
MKYPCIPVFMKNREKDPFDYPLRSKKDIAFEQYMRPPMFGMKVIANDYQVISQNKTYAVHKADNRNNIAKIELNLNHMDLSPLQEKRLIFLLGPRYKKNKRTFKIVSRQYNNWEHNMARIMDIFRQLYWEAKRAPAIYLPLMKSKQRRKLRDRILGEGLTPHEREEKIKHFSQLHDEGRAEFEQLWESGTYSREHLNKKIEVILKEKFKTENDELSEEGKLSAERAEELFKRENIEKELVKKRILTPKAYETFYGKNALETNNNEEGDKNKQ